MGNVTSHEITENFLRISNFVAANCEWNKSLKVYHNYWLQDGNTGNIFLKFPYKGILQITCKIPFNFLNIQRATFPLHYAQVKISWIQS